LLILKKADQTISPNITRSYYDTALALDPRLHDYFRLFFAPGLQHCLGGYGWYPPNITDALVDWVEKDIAPDAIMGQTLADPTTGERRYRKLCPWPQKSIYKGSGSGNAPDDFYCG
jgi:hypothetical protein